MSRDGDKPDFATAVCACVADPFAELPPDMRPRPQSRMGNLRRVTCPACGLNYWTNRAIDLCVDCEKQGVARGQEDGG